MEPKTFLVVVPFYWGRGDTLRKAKAQARKAGYNGDFPKSSTMLMSFPDGTKPWVDDFWQIRCDCDEKDAVTIQKPTKV